MRVLHALMILCGFVLVSPAAGDLIVYEEDREGWEAAIGNSWMIDFVGFKDGTLIREQFADQGVHFVRDNDTVSCCSTFVFPRDGAGLDANDLLVLDFDDAISGLAFDFAGNIRVDVFLGGTLVGDSGGFVGKSGPGRYAGFISPTPFDRVVVDGVGSLSVTIDDIHLGLPIPAPCASVVLLGAALRRRRRPRH